MRAVSFQPVSGPTPFARSVVDAIAAIAGSPAPLHEPSIGGNEWIYVKECLDTGWVSSVGAYVDRFEAMLRDLTGSPFAVATSSGSRRSGRARAMPSAIG